MDLNAKVSFLSEEDLGLKPITENIPAATPVVVEKPKDDVVIPAKDDKTIVPPKITNTTAIPLLTDEEVVVVPGKEGEPDKKKLTTEDIESAIDIKALIEAKIETGAWKKWENWDEVKDKTEFTQELYLQLEQEQFEAKVEEKILEEKAALPKRVQEITDFIKQGGREEDLYASYQQELDIEALDPENPEEAETLIQAHCEATGWTDKRTKNYINSLKDQGTDSLKETAKESKESLVQVVKEEREQTIQAQANAATQKKAYEETFNRQLREAIFKETDTPERDKKALEKFLFEPKNVDKAGNKVSDFGMKWREIVTDPVKYHKFVKFVKDFDKFEDKSKTETKVTNRITNFLRSSQSDLGKNVDTPAVELQKKTTVSNPNWFKTLKTA